MEIPTIFGFWGHFRLKRGKFGALCHHLGQKRAKRGLFRRFCHQKQELGYYAPYVRIWHTFTVRIWHTRGILLLSFSHLFWHFPIFRALKIWQGDILWYSRKWNELRCSLISRFLRPGGGLPIPASLPPSLIFRRNERSGLMGGKNMSGNGKSV